MPIGILGSLVICTVLYVLMGGLLTGVVHYSQLNVAAPVARAIDATGVGWGSILIKVGTFAGLSTTMLVMLIGQSRVFFSMSRDGLLPEWAARVHPRFRTPHVATPGHRRLRSGDRRTVPDRQCSVRWCRSAPWSHSSSCARAC